MSSKQPGSSATSSSKQWKGFVEGGIASVIAGVATHPFDLVKVRMQLMGEGVATIRTTTPSFTPHNLATNVGSIHAAPPPPPPLPFRLPTSSGRPSPLSVARQVVSTDGVAGLFSGVSATVIRQVLYSSTRMGVYDALKAQLEDENKKLPGYKKIGAGLFSGAVGAIVGNPAELAMVRMQADGRLPLEQRRNYRNGLDAILRTAREEGVVALWRGCGPTVYRAMAVTTGQLATYDTAKEAILSNQVLPDGFLTHVCSAMAAAVVASVASNPFDVVKTRLMNMAKENAAYTGPLDCALKTVQKEGPFALYKGFVPTVTRQLPYLIVLFVSLEQVKRLMAKI